MNQPAARGQRSPATQPLRPPRRNERQDMRQGGSAVSVWEQEWRSGVMSQLGEIADKQESTAVILERLNNFYVNHDNRIKALEEQPAKSQAKFLGITGVSINALWAAISIISFLVVVVAPHWR